MKSDQVRGVGKNVLVNVEGTTLHIRVNLAEQFGSSKSGKSITVGSTGGIQKVPGFPELRYGVNVFQKLPTAPKAA